MSLQASTKLAIGNLSVDLAVTVEPGEVVAILGPNGAGKTTFLRALAGLIPLEQGRITLNDRVLVDTRAGIDVAASHRSVGFVFQDYLLFPHLTARQNVAFGLSASQRRAGFVEKWLSLTGIEDVADLRPAQLSGGQRQRVALARALAPRPQLVLLDEPLAAVDAVQRTALRRNLRRHLEETDAVRVLVTHDPLEAAGLADRVVILEHGRITQSGTLIDLSRQPRSSYIAELVGVNFYAGRARDGKVALDTGGDLTAAGSPEGDVFVTVHPRAVALHRQRPDGTPRNVWQGRVDAIEPSLDHVRITVHGQPQIVAEVTPAGAAQVGEGEPVWVSIKASEVRSYPR